MSLRNLVSISRHRLAHKSELRHYPLNIGAKRTGNDLRSMTTRATFHYLEDREEYRTVKPYHINIPERALDSGLQSNEVSIPYHDIPVTGLRGIFQDFSLDRNGFTVETEDKHDGNALCNALQYEEYADEKAVRVKARKAVEQFLKRAIPGCEDAVAFSHQVRESSS
jgi:hypothetical protein